jgi:hypothetical protein
MNKLIKLAIVAAGASLAVQGAFAGPNNNDLIFSINNNDGGGTTEFTVNLGLESSYVAPNYDLSSLLGSYSSYASAGAPSLNVGVVGGQNGQGGLSGAGNDVFTTTLRVGDGSYLTPGSEGAPAVTPANSRINSAGGIAGGFSGYAPNLATTDGTSFSANVAFDPSAAGTAANSFVSYLGQGANPLQAMGGTGSIVLDLWKDTTTSTSANTSWVYQGNFTLDLSGVSPSLVWDAAPVPEPSTYSLFGGVGFGLLALCLRRKLRSKKA